MGFCKLLITPQETPMMTSWVRKNFLQQLDVFQRRCDDWSATHIGISDIRVITALFG